MVKILHISDLHFGPPYLPRVGEALLKVAPAIEADVIVASGDFTQRAKRDQFKQAKAYLEQLPDLPLVVVPGNHDVPLYRVAERMMDPHRLYKEFISAELNRTWSVDGAFFVGIDSTAPRTAISNGRITSGQLDWCKQAFEDAPPDAWKIVVAHHHFSPAPDYERDQVMPKGKRALRKFVDIGVDLVLGGHLHRAYIGNSLDIYPGEHRERGVIIVQSGTTTSRRGRAREREKNSFNVIETHEEMVRVTHYMFFDDLETFAPMSQHTFPKPGQRFVNGVW